MVVNAPNLVACCDLVERLAEYSPQTLSGGGGDDCCELVLFAPANRLPAILAELQRWGSAWDMRTVEAKVDRRHYSIRTPASQSWIDL